MFKIKVLHRSHRQAMEKMIWCALSHEIAAILFGAVCSCSIIQVMFLRSKYIFVKKNFSSQLIIYLYNILSPKSKVFL